MNVKKGCCDQDHDGHHFHHINHYHDVDIKEEDKRLETQLVSSLRYVFFISLFYSTNIYLQDIFFFITTAMATHHNHHTLPPQPAPQPLPPRQEQGPGHLKPLIYFFFSPNVYLHVKSLPKRGQGRG